MKHVAVHLIHEGGHKDTIVVGGDATWGKLRAVLNQAEGLVVIGPDTTEPAEEATLAALAEQKTIVMAGAIRMEFSDGAKALADLAALAIHERRPDPSSYAIQAMPDIASLKDFRIQEMPDHQPRFTSRDFRRQAKNRPPKTR